MVKAFTLVLGGLFFMAVLNGGNKMIGVFAAVIGGCGTKLTKITV